MKKLSKNFKKSLETIWDKKENLSIWDAVDLALKTSTTKFDSTVELHVNLNVDVKHADQMVRWVIVLPNWTWKTVKIAAFVQEENIKAAKAAWADLAWADDLIDTVSKGEIDFDIAVATPDMMKSLSKIAKVLWPKGLMPTPKAWTISQDFEAAIKVLKKGQVEYKADKFWITHNWIWKVSFWKDKIVENVKTILWAIFDAKPSWIKWQYVETIAISTTMWPSLLLDKNLALEECK